MRQRLITGLIGGGFFLLFVYLGGDWYRFLISVLAVRGFYEMLRLKSIKFLSWHGIAGFIFLLIFLFPFDWRIRHLFSLFNFELFLYALLSYLLILTVLSKNKISFDDISFIFMSLLYLLFGFKFMLETRFIDESGLLWTFLILILTWTTDTGAYFFGRFFGKKHLWPAISPNKTIEGSLGGLMFSVLAAVIFLLFFPFVSYLHGLITAIIVSIAAQFGDLIESAVKRHYKVKDMGSILPGHGGVVDRFDSLLFVFPLLHLLHII